MLQLFDLSSLLGFWRAIDNALRAEVRTPVDAVGASRTFMETFRFATVGREGRRTVDALFNMLGDRIETKERR